MDEKKQVKVSVTNTSYTWVIGAMFTIGLHWHEFAHWYDALWVIVLWPFVLGGDVSHLLKLAGG